MKHLIIPLILLLLISCGSNPQKPVIYNVRFEVAGSTIPVDVTFGFRELRSIDMGVFPLWVSPVCQIPEGTSVFLSVSRSDQNSPDSDYFFILTIYRNGKVFKTTTGLNELAMSIGGII